MKQPVPTTPTAPVFDIERYAVEDGPGIRSVVFFKGCNLRCAWCQNPESHVRTPQVMYYRAECTACGRCTRACPVGAVADIPPHGFITDQTRCTLCGACIDACFSNARRIIGSEMTADEIMTELLKDRTYYEESGGGVTFSGGEPLLYPEMVAELARRCRAEGVHTALETAGLAPWEVLAGLLPLINLLFFDFKHIDSNAHRAATGVPNERIMDNIKHASERTAADAAGGAGRMVVRIPVIPEVNADEVTLTRMFAWLMEETKVRNVELLPFHRLGGNKYSGLGMEYGYTDTPNMDRDQCRPYAEIGRKLGLAVSVGAEGS